MRIGTVVMSLFMYSYNFWQIFKQLYSLVFTVTCGFYHCILLAMLQALFHWDFLWYMTGIKHSFFYINCVLFSFSYQYTVAIFVRHHKTFITENSFCWFTWTGIFIFDVIITSFLLLYSLTFFRCLSDFVNWEYQNKYFI